MKSYKDPKHSSVSLLNSYHAEEISNIRTRWYFCYVVLDTVVLLFSWSIGLFRKIESIIAVNTLALTLYFARRVTPTAVEIVDAREQLYTGKLATLML